MRIEVCLTCDDNYAKYCATVIASAIENKNPEDEPVFHIVHGGLSQENIEKLSKFENVVFHLIDDDLFKPYLRKAKLSWPTSTLYRLKLASILDFDKVIYLDCDVVVTSSLKDYFEQDIEDYYLGGVPDVSYTVYMERLNIPQENGYFYLNAGSILMNLKKFREDNIEEKLFDCLINNWNEFSFGDQDILNLTLHKKVKELDKKFNYIPTMLDLDPSNKLDLKSEVVVIHYAGQKPWELSLKSKIRGEFWKYYKVSGFVSKMQFFKEHTRFKLGNLFFVQMGYLLKMYPFGMFRKSKQYLFKLVYKNFVYKIKKTLKKKNPQGDWN